jgi:hypothetical protein
MSTRRARLTTISGQETFRGIGQSGSSDEDHGGMPMGPAEIVASLKELCVDEGPRLSTERIVRWVDRHGGYESERELIAFAKKMKARQFARRLMYDDEESGLRMRRLWSFRDRTTGKHYYADVAQLAPERRRKLVQQYARFLDQLRSVRRAMSDYFAGQQFFDFYTLPEEDDAPALRRRAQISARRA